MTVRRGLVAVFAALALVGTACSASEVAGNVQQCAQVSVAVAKVSVVAAGSQASGQDLSTAADALGDVGEVPEQLTGAFDTLNQAFADGKGSDDPAVQSAYDEIRTWVEQECVAGSLGDLLPGG
jgi:hypothetical protein